MDPSLEMEIVFREIERDSEKRKLPDLDELTQRVLPATKSKRDGNYVFTNEIENILSAYLGFFGNSKRKDQAVATQAVKIVSDKDKRQLCEKYLKWQVRQLPGYDYSSKRSYGSVFIAKRLHLYLYLQGEIMINDIEGNLRGLGRKINGEQLPLQERLHDIGFFFSNVIKQNKESDIYTFNQTITILGGWIKTIEDIARYDKLLEYYGKAITGADIIAAGNEMLKKT